MMSNPQRKISRRSAAIGMAAAMCAARGANAQMPPPWRYAVVSLVGDKFTVVIRGQVTGSRLNPNAQRELDVPHSLLDRTALAAAVETLRKSDPTAQPTPLLIEEPVLYEQQDRLFDKGFVRLPTAVADAARAAGTTHVLLLTKHRAAAEFRFLNTTDGQGSLRGVGFYVEQTMPVQEMDKLDVRGFLGTYVYIKATVVDLRNEAIVAERTTNAGRIYTAADERAKSSRPWDAIDNNEKLRALMEHLDVTVRKLLPEVIGAASKS